MTESREIVEALNEIANAPAPPARNNSEPDNSDWRVVALEMQRIAKLALASLPQQAGAGGAERDIKQKGGDAHAERTIRPDNNSPGVTTGALAQEPVSQVSARRDALRILRMSYITLAFAFRRLHESARSRDGELCKDFQKVRAEIEKHFRKIGVPL